MLDVIGRAFRNCDRVTRREVLKVGALAFGGATLADLLRHKALAQEAGARLRDTAVIQIFMGGGPSHIDMYDLKPDAPAEVRGEFRPIPTNVPGIEISEHLPRLAAVMDKLAIVRSITHTNSSHLPSSHLVLTGYEPATVPKDNLNPCPGSVVAKLRGPNRPGLPPYVAVPRKISYGTAAYLGAAYNPFTTDNEPNRDDFYVRNLKLNDGVTLGRLEQRGNLLTQFDSMRRDLDLRGDLEGLDDFTRDAMAMVTSERAAQAFDISREDPKLRERYGPSLVGQSCLLARRLIEAGVTYVTCLSGGGWDTHVDNFNEMKKVSLPRFDQAISALVTDLAERGLSQRVFFMAFGEFGRTPRINRDAGRDHWPGAASALIAGGGLKMGQVVGATDRHAAYPTSDPYPPSSVLATLYRHMGIDTNHLFYDQNNRPMPVLPQRRPIAELL